MSERPPRDAEKDKEMQKFGLKVLLAVGLPGLVAAVVLAWRL